MKQFILVILMVLDTVFPVYAQWAMQDITTDMEFVGSVIDSSPNWKWQIWPDTPAWAQDWNVDIRDGIVENGITTFDYKENKGCRRKNYLQGYISRPAEKGGALLTPVISVSTIDGLQRLNYSALKQPISVRAVGHALDGTTTEGTMSLVVESSLAVFFKKTSVPNKYFVMLNNTNGGTIPTVARGVLMEHLVNFRDIYTNQGEQTHLWKDCQYDVSRVLSGVDEMDAYDITAGYSSSLSDVKTHWHTVPTQWTAQLNIQVQVI